MRYKFLDNGVEKTFFCDFAGIECFCAGGYWYNFNMATAAEVHNVKAWDNDDPTVSPDAKALFERLLTHYPRAFVLFCDQVDGFTKIFDGIEEGIVEGNFKYVVKRSEHVFNWNSGNHCRIMTVQLTDLADRYEPEEAIDFDEESLDECCCPDCRRARGET